MLSEQDERSLRKCYSEIIHGFSISTFEKKKIFIKHFSSLDNLETDFLYKEQYDKVSQKGYPTEKQRLEQLEKDRLWASGDENNLAGVKDYIKNLSLTKKKALLKRDIDSINDQIKEQERLFTEMSMKRQLLIGATVENFTKRSVDAYLISKSFFEDILLKKLFYSQEEFDNLDQQELGELFLIYNRTMENFSELNIRKIALAPFFQNAFSLSENAYEFYGRPVCYLSHYQVQLSIYGNYYKNMLQGENRPPDDILNDPDKLEDWYSSKANVDQLLEKSSKEEDSNVSIVGATKEDLKNWGYDQSGISLKEATKKAGGVMDKEQLMALYGVK